MAVLTSFTAPGGFPFHFMLLCCAMDGAGVGSFGIISPAIFRKEESYSRWKGQTSMYFLPSPLIFSKKLLLPCQEASSRTQRVSQHYFVPLIVALLCPAATIGSSLWWQPPGHSDLALCGFLCQPATFLCWRPWRCAPVWQPASIGAAGAGREELPSASSLGSRLLSRFLYPLSVITVMLLECCCTFSLTYQLH